MDVSIWTIMLPAFAECLVLVGIHSYLGIHVIKRKVIFVDLALAQIAALGTTVAFLLGINPASTGTYWFSLGFTFVGAAIFSLSRLRSERIPQEAVIGLVYALAAAAAIVAVDRGPHGAEHIKEILTGSILWVKWETILTAAVIYLLVGIFHFIFRDKFLMISRNPEAAYQKGINVRFWDFLFYLSFGVVITHSVNTAGVLLVFVFLVVPAIATIMLTDKLWLQLILGWSMGTMVSFLGLYFSYSFDLPSGPTVVLTYGSVLLITSIGVYLWRAPVKTTAFKRVASGMAVFLLIVLLFWEAGKYFTREPHPEAEHADSEYHPGSNPDKAEHRNSEKRTLPSDSLLQLEEKFRGENNDLNRYQLALSIWNLDQKNGSLKMVSLLKNAKIPFVRQKALEQLKEAGMSDYGYDPLLSPELNRTALQQIEKWWQHRYAL
ncbi:MAG: metal ABC transporter permease [Calditrichia bacterium]